MAGLDEVTIPALPPERFETVLTAEQFARFQQAIRDAQRVFAGRRVWNVNSTAMGGGVAEMLRSLLAYARGAGVDARWLVIPGQPEFFRVTKRLHNHLHGSSGDGGELDEQARAIYERNSESYVSELISQIAPDDVVIVHDPQPASAVPHLSGEAAVVIWRSHVGLDLPNDLARRAWAFLMPYVEPANAFVFSRQAFIWEGLRPTKAVVIPPSIDAFSPKNQELSPSTVDAILVATRLISNGAGGEPGFSVWDGTRRTVQRATVLYDGQPPPPSSAPLVVQVSRWDRLKDPLGVIAGFAEHVAPGTDAHLVVAGPAVEGVADDPEGAEVLDEALGTWERLPEQIRGRVHLACIPMVDGDENAAIVNALQRRATIVVQKSIAEGFGLTVAEAMWKARPVVASRIGGIQDQIVDEDSGLLLDDPADLQQFGAAVRSLLDDPDRAGRMARRAQERVRHGFLGARHLMQYLDLIRDLLA